jgi:hypothetical protein
LKKLIQKIQSIKKQKAFYRNSLKDYRTNFDPKDNKDSMIPEDEELRQNCIWISEVYPPEYINELISNLKKLNWKSTGSFSNSNTIHDKLTDFRKNDKKGWSNLGYLFSSPKGLIINPNICNLPEGVGYIHLSLSQLISSTSIIIFRFVIKDEATQRIEKPLNDTYITYNEKLINGVRHITPTEQKTKKFNEVRNKIILDCKQWIKLFVGGYYCKNHLLNKMPSCEFVTLKENSPFTDKKVTIPFDFMHILKFNYSSNTWKFEEYEGLYFQFNTPQRIFNSKMEIVGKLSDIRYKSKNETRSSSTISSLTNELRFLYSTLDKFALYYLFYTLKVQLAEIRDEISNIKINNINKANSQLRNISFKFAILERNLPIFITELKDICKNKEYFLENAFSFYKLNPNSKSTEKDESENLLNKIRLTLLDDSERVLVNYNYVKQSINTISSTINSLTSNKYSKINLWTQVIMIFLSIAMLFLAVTNIINRDEKKNKMDKAIIYKYYHPLEESSPNLH